MYGGVLPNPAATSQVVQVDRIRGIAEYLTTPADPMQWVWLGVIVIGLVVLIFLLYLVNQSQQKKREARRRLRRMKRQKAKAEQEKQHPGFQRRRFPRRSGRR